ncbi:MAG: DUF4339 domain-containing protein [Bradymonadaceae bacterium]|nr:DUF4339 domain-containing protein [Lujinxingiaceae bacterium]
MATVAWHYAINGESFGPLSFEKLSVQFASGKLGDAVYVWNESFTEWKPVRDVAAFADALGDGQAVRPAKSTIGISTALQAVRIEDYEPGGAPRKRAPEAASKPGASKSLFTKPADSKPVQLQRADKVADHSDDEPLDTVPDSLNAKLSEPAAQEAAAEEPVAIEPAPAVIEPVAKEPVVDQEPVEPEAVAPEPEPEPEPVKLAIPVPRALPSIDRASATGDVSPRERLQRLRDRLKLDEGSEASDEVSEASIVDHGVDLALGDTVDVSPGQAVDPSRAAVQKSALGSGEFALPPSGRSRLKGTHDGLFSGADAGKALAAGASASDSVEPDEEEGPSDQVPFFPSAPMLTSSQAHPSATSGEFSGSLLIQLDKIKKQGRGKAIAGIVAAVVIVGGLVGVGAYISANREAPEPVAKAERVQPREVVFRRYSKEEQGRMHNLMELSDDVITREESKAFVEQEAQRPEEGAVAKTAAKTAKTGGTSSAGGAVDPFEQAMNAAVAHDPNAAKGGLQREGGAPVAAVKGAPDGTRAKTADDDRFNALAAIQSPSGESPIYRPKAAAVVDRPTLEGTGLTAEQAQAGFRTVRQSIGLCRERTMRRGLNIDAQKIYVTIEVQPSGKVSSFQVDPESVRGTEFDRCMISHTERWNFAAFGGQAITIKAPFVLQ